MALALFVAGQACGRKRAHQQLEQAAVQYTLMLEMVTFLVP